MASNARLVNLIFSNLNASFAEGDAVAQVVALTLALRQESNSVKLSQTVFVLSYEIIKDCQQPSTSGCSAAWLARLTGGQKVRSSNLLTPTRVRTIQES